MKIKKKFNILFLLVSIVLLSCQKQKAPNLENQETKRAEDMERLQACTDVNFKKGILLHQNTLLLFKCTKWDIEFPNMYKAMKEIKEGSWNQLFTPINESILDNQVRKNKFFKSIHDLDNNKGLDDLSYVIEALNESNFFDAIKKMFLCIDSPSDEKCEHSIDKIPKRSSIKRILHLLDIPSETVEKGVAVLKEVNKGLAPQQEQLRNEINKFKISPMMTSLKIKLIDEIMRKFNLGLSDPDREFVTNIMLSKDNDKNPWLYTWIQDQQLGRLKFRDLFEYPILTNPALIGEVRGLKNAYNQNFGCSIYNKNDINETIEFDFKTHMANYVSLVKERGYKSFYDFSTNDIVGLKMSTSICSELENNQYGVNFIQLIADMADFVKEKKNYDLFKFLVVKTDLPYNQNNTFSQNLYLFDIVAGNIFLNANDMGKEIVARTREFYPALFDVIKGVSAKAYFNTGEVSQELFQKENDNIFKGISDYWLFLNLEEKNFLLNFLDRHFDNNIKYVMLLDFYIKQLEDYKDIRPIFQKAWLEDEQKEEWTMLSIEDFVKEMSGKEALSDFKKFFSRDQIIKVLEVLSSGQQIAEMAQEKLKYRDSTSYVLQAKNDKYTIYVSDNETYDSSEVLKCIKNFSEIKNGFYDLINNFPMACQKVASENLGLRMFGWLNIIKEDYSRFNIPENESTSLFDKEGLLGPYMINSQIGLLKVLDSVVSPYKSNVRNKGLEYLLQSLDYYLNKKDMVKLVDKNITMINQWQEVDPINNILYRNSVLKKFTELTNFSTSQRVFKEIAEMTEEYGKWIQSGGWQEASNRNLGKHLNENDCSVVINQNVSPNPCPSKDKIKKIGNDILFLLSNIWEKDEGSPISLLLQAQKAGEGLDIPLDNKNAKKYRLTLRETFQYLYNTSDKTKSVNKKKVFFTNEKGQVFNNSLTTLERIETVIREVSFKNNYLGVSYLNHVVFGEDYNNDVLARKSILSKCIKIPGARCGRKMSADDLRMARNALATYDGLYDVNTTEGEDGGLYFGNYLKTFQQTFVGSSSKDAQEVKFLPLSDEVLKKHNGKILSHITNLTGFSNLARVIRDRIGRTRGDFNKFIEREDFKRVDRTLLNGFDLPETSLSAEILLKKMMDQHILNDAVDWLDGLSYEQTRLVEDTVARLLVVTSYLGEPELVFNQSSEIIDNRYKENNIAKLFMALEKIVNYYPNIVKYFPADAKLINLIKPINTFLYFVTNQLNNSTDPAKNTMYQVLNDFSLIAQTLIFDDIKETRILNNENKVTKGLNLIMQLLGSPEKLATTMNTIRENYNYMDIFFTKGNEAFMSFGQNIGRLTSEIKFDLTPVRKYLEFTTKNSLCILEEKDCVKNYHYDEIPILLKYLQQKSTEGESNFMVANKKIFKENLNQITQMIGDIFPAIRIKEIKQPLIMQRN